ncbi:MAG: Si-specific NAD(P)(+) transhydrogenase [Gammaproteobacteria bacterium]|nr:Si-specific NAD(P)(+) transhydrogenase [Gammaproteobacteria bacterium]
MNKYDLVVIGSGPAGQRAAIQAAKLGHSVAVIERSFSIGGACVHTGTIPSKTLREAVLYLTGWRQRGFYGRSYRVKERITVEDLMQRLDITVRHEIEQLMHKLSRNFVDVIAGRAEFESPHTLRIEIKEDESRLIEADKIMIATGSRPVQPPNVPFDAPNIMDSDHILSIQEIPRSLVVVGAGVIGVEYASILSALDIDVTVVDGRKDMLGFLDREIVDEFAHHLRDRGVKLRLAETVESVEVIDDKKLIVHLASGKRVRANMALFASGRQSNTDQLNLEKAGLTPDERGRLAVDGFFRTEVDHIYAAGDVIGFPALASTSMEQGRQGSLHAFGDVVKPIEQSLFPFGIYAVPEMSVVGKTEEELRNENIPYESGVARFRETSRGQILGLREGLLKLLVRIEDRRLLGVHIVGEGATELIHIGQAVLAHEGNLDFFVDAVFNYPTLAETYMIAALDAWNKL